MINKVLEVFLLLAYMLLIVFSCYVVIVGKPLEILVGSCVGLVMVYKLVEHLCYLWSKYLVIDADDIGD